MRNNKLAGFTLIEIMIVIAIVIALVTIAVPGFLRSRVTALEASAVANCRAIDNGCQLYHINNDIFPANLTDLSGPASYPPYIDSVLASGRKNSYEYIYTLVDPDHFTLNANPTTTGLLKGRYFYTDESGIIRFKVDSEAGPDDEIFK